MLRVTIEVAAETDVTAGDLVEVVPSGWIVADAGDGRYDAAAGTITWSVGPIDARGSSTEAILLAAPTVPTSDGAYELPATFAARFEQGTTSSAAPPIAVIVAPRVVVAHYVLTSVSGIPPRASVLAPDTWIGGEPRFESFRVRFGVVNPDTLPLTWVPQLEYRAATGVWTAVAPSDPVPGLAFYVSREWIVNPGPEGGTMLGPETEAIDPGSLTIDEKSGANDAFVAGMHSLGPNPLGPTSLPGLTSTAIEFSVRATVDADYLATYEFRITDASQALPGAIQPSISMGAPPDIALSPGQRAGAPGNSMTADSTGTGPSRYTLVASAAGLGAATPDPIHGPYSLTTDACGACHRAHTASGTSLTTASPPQYGLCASCHDGSGPPSAANVTAVYGAAPSNDPATRSYYQHDPTQISGHLTAETDAFAGVSNRHAECADCHSPHRSAPSPDASPDPAGWSVSGRLEGATGASVSNGGAGTAPTYTLVPAPAQEYQLCFKCHSGYTQLLANPTPTAPAPTPFTQFELDKGVEFNPNNLSFHPIEAPGRNTTAAMDASLAGTSPYKLWNFTSGSTIRCLNCHADSSKLPAVVPVPAPVAGTGSSLPVHASQNRGILLQPYRDRDLKGWTEAYGSADFALCYSCHAEAPFVDTSGDVRSDTNFRYHGLHVSGVNLVGHGSPTTSIDTPGNGGGLATCSECHFRIHSTSFAVPGQSIDGQRLVNFAPDVLPDALRATLGWTARTDTGAGTCTLTCHGQPHRPRTY